MTTIEEDWQCAKRQVDILLRDMPKTFVPLAGLNIEQAERLEARMFNLAYAVEGILNNLQKRVSYAPERNRRTAKAKGVTRR